MKGKAIKASSYAGDLLTWPFPASARILIARPVWVIAIAITLSCCLVGTCVGQDGNDEDHVRAATLAASLLNFGKFVEWPETAGPTEGPLKICVAGDFWIALKLTELAGGKTIAGKKVKVLLLRSRDSSEGCQILFIARAAGKDRKTLLQGVQNSPTLTVGEEEDFAEDGGILTILRGETRIRFEINQEAAAQAGLKISSKLLALAKTAHGKS